MALADMIKLPGVQGMLKTLLQAAAPELGEQVQDIANVILAFKEQCDRIEAAQKRIEYNQYLIARNFGVELPQEDKHGTGLGNGVAGNSGQIGETGSASRQ